MTERNYLYRTDPLFLRNQLETAGKYGIPMIPKPELSINELDGIRFIGFDKAKADQGKHGNRIVHFFLYDYAFERIWNRPEQSIDMLRRYKAVLTPDFSIYTEMPEALQLYNTFRNRWCGAYFAAQGLRVIPTVNFGLEGSFDFAFEGIAPGSAVAVSTYMVQSKEGREAQKEFFLAGYNELLRRIEPEVVLCYHEPFPEMQGNVIPVDYSLSSWQHMDDDVAEPEKEGESTPSAKGFSVWKTGYVLRENDAHAAGQGERNSNEPDKIVKYGGYVVQLGSGSAYGGKWKPKNADAERYIGKPGEIKTTYDSHGNRRDTKIGDDGYAERERHYTDHGHPHKHTNPHDHEIKWDSPDKHPDPQGQINYPDGFPEFKRFKGVLHMSSNNDSMNFGTIAEFQESMRYHAEVEFEYQGKHYGIVPEWGEVDGMLSFYEAYKPETEIIFDSSDKLLDHKIGDKKLREIITEVTILFRSI